LGIMSKETAAQLDPFIDNPEVEHDRVIAEGIEQALVAGIQQQAAAGAMPPMVLAKVMRLVQNDRMELAEALEKVTQEALEEQEAQQQEQMAMAEEQMMSPDQAMSGAALRSMVGPEGMARAEGPNATQQNLMSLLSTLRRPQTAAGGV